MGYVAAVSSRAASGLAGSHPMTFHPPVLGGGVWDPFGTLRGTLWIGGGQWAGKSTIARNLARRYGLTAYHYDYHDARGHEDRRIARRVRLGEPPAVRSTRTRAYCCTCRCTLAAAGVRTAAVSRASGIPPGRG